METSLESDIVEIGGDVAGAKKIVRFDLSKVDGSNECLEVEVSVTPVSKVFEGGGANVEASRAVDEMEESGGDIKR